MVGVAAGGVISSNDRASAARPFDAASKAAVATPWARARRRSMLDISGGREVVTRKRLSDRSCDTDWER